MEYNKYAVIDVETTGLDMYNDRITEISIIVLDQQFRVVRTFDSLVASGEAAELCGTRCEAERVSKIDYKLLRLGEDRQAPLFWELIPEIAETLRDCGMLVGHNVAFDAAMLMRELVLAAGGTPRSKQECESPFDVGAFAYEYRRSGQTVCTLKTFQALRNGQSVWTRVGLRHIAEWYGLPVPAKLLHTAFADAAMAARVFALECLEGFLPPVMAGPVLRVLDTKGLEQAIYLRHVEQVESLQSGPGVTAAVSRVPAEAQHQILKAYGWKLMAE